MESRSISSLPTKKFWPIGLFRIVLSVAIASPIVCSVPSREHEIRTSIYRISITRIDCTTITRTSS